MNGKLVLLCTCLLNGVLFGKYCPMPNKAQTKSAPAKQMHPSKQVIAKKLPAQAPKPMTQKAMPVDNDMVDIDSQWEQLLTQIEKAHPDMPAGVKEGMKKDFRKQFESHMSKLSQN